MNKRRYKIRPMVGENLNRAMREHGFNQASLAEKSKVPQGTISRIITGKSRDPKNDILDKLANALDTNTAQLRNDRSNGTLTSRASSSRRNNYASSDFTLVPNYVVEAAAGHGSEVIDEEQDGLLAFRRDWIEDRMGLDPDQLKAIQASGDSMVPTIHDGDVLLLNMEYDRVSGDGIYVIRQDNQLIVKRLSVQVGGTIRVQSDNAAYETQEISMEVSANLAIIGRVVWIGRKL